MDYRDFPSDYEKPFRVKQSLRIIRFISMYALEISFLLGIALVLLAVLLNA